MQLELTANMLSARNDPLITFTTAPKERQPQKAETKKTAFLRRIAEGHRQIISTRNRATMLVSDLLF